MPMPQPAACRPPLPDVLCAVLVMLLVLLAGGRLLLAQPGLAVAARTPAPALRWRLPLLPPAAVVQAGQPLPATAMPAADGRGSASPVAGQEGADSTLVATEARAQASRPALATARPPAAEALFAKDGSIALPAQSLAQPERRSSAQRMFEQHDEGFLKHPDDGLFGRAEIAGTAQTRAQRAVFGRDVQPARARAAPAIAYNPALHERAADLAAADGPQAYLSAPVADAPVPGLDGQASAQLQPERASRRSRVQACRLPAMATAWAALEQHLQHLQQAEQRMGHGASPEERRHTLTHEIGRQYNLARRALWQVDHLLPRCP